VFDSLNYIENMRLGIDAVGTAGGIVEASICYTGDITRSEKDIGKYTLDYYLQYARELKEAGVHVLNVKDMAGYVKLLFPLAQPGPSIYILQFSASD
jgi:pyruvate carboxylase